jgi:hypothetical protein
MDLFLYGTRVLTEGRGLRVWGVGEAGEKPIARVPNACCLDELLPTSNETWDYDELNP